MESAGDPSGPVWGVSLVSRLRAAFLDATRLIPVNTVVELEADTLLLVTELAPRLGTSWGVGPPIASETRQETAP
jgi:hypothetical protein